MTRKLSQAVIDVNKIEGIERKGVFEARKIGAKIKAAAIASWRNKKPFNAKPLIDKMQPTLRDALLAAHLESMYVSVKRAEKKEIKLSVFSDTISKYKKFLSGVDLKKLREYYDTRAFDILGEEAEIINVKMRDTIAGLVEEGAHVKEGVETLKARIETLGVDKKNDFRLETIFRTQTQFAYSAGKYAADQDPAIQDILWGYEYVTVGDDRVRESHERLDGVRLPKDDPFWKIWWPPNGWNCRCQVIQIFNDDPEAKKKSPPKGDLGADKDWKFNPGILINKSIA